MIRALLAALLLLGSLSAATPQAGYPVGPLPTATGQAATGQIPGTATNDCAAAGKVGEIARASSGAESATVTITNASPTVITWTGHPYVINCSGIVSASVINFTTTGGLPTGLVVGTNYYAVPIDANTLHVATSVANALAGTFINTSSAGSGVQTGVATSIHTGGVGAILDVAGIALTAGDWNCNGSMALIASSTVTRAWGWINTASANGTIPDALIPSQTLIQAPFTSATNQILPLGTSGISVASTSNVYFSAFHVFAGTVSGFNSGMCRRAR